MEPSADQPAESPAAPAEAAPEAPRWDARRGLVRLVVSLLVFFVAMSLLAKFFGPRIEGAGKTFVESFGLAGLAFGTVLADAFSLPPPPLFYIVIVATGSGSHVVGMTVISLASMLSGVIGYHVAARLGNWPFFRKRLDATRARMDALLEKYGVWAFAIASATPIPFSWMCYVGGVYRVRYRLLAFICLFRIPRLLVMYWLVRAGWVTGSG